MFKVLKGGKIRPFAYHMIVNLKNNKKNEKNSIRKLNTKLRYRNHYLSLITEKPKYLVKNKQMAI